MAQFALGAAGAAIPVVGPLAAAIGGILGAEIDRKLGIFGKPEPLRAPDTAVTLASEGTPGTYVWGLANRIPLHYIWASIPQLSQSTGSNKRLAAQPATVFESFVCCAAFAPVGPFDQIIAEGKRVWVGVPDLDITATARATLNSGLVGVYVTAYRRLQSPIIYEIIIQNERDGSGNPVAGSPDLTVYDVGSQFDLLLDGLYSDGSGTHTTQSKWEVLERRYVDAAGNSMLRAYNLVGFPASPFAPAGGWNSKVTTIGSDQWRVNAGVIVFIDGALVSLDPRVFPSGGGVHRFITTSKSSLLTTYNGAGNTSRYPDVEIIDVDNPALGSWGNRAPQWEAIVAGLNDTGGTITGLDGTKLVGALKDICRNYGGIGAAELTFECTDRDLRGLVVFGPFAPIEPVTKVFALQDLVWQEGGGGDYSRLARVIDGTARDTVPLPTSGLNVAVGKGAFGAEDIAIGKIDPNERIKKVTVKFSNYEHGLQAGEESENLDTLRLGQDVTLEAIDCALTPDEAKAIARRLIRDSSLRIGKANIIVGWEDALYVQEDDVVTFTDRAGESWSLLVESVVTTPDWQHQIEGYVVAEVPGVVAGGGGSVQSGSREGNLGSDERAQGATPLVFQAVELRPVDDAHAGMVGVYVGAAPSGNRVEWDGASVWMRRPSDEWIEVGQLQKAALIGYVATALPSGATTGFDVVNSIGLEVRHGSPAATTEALCDLGKNLVALGSEVLGFTDVAEVDEENFTLSNLSRGRCDTAAAVGGHADNEILMGLDDSLVFVRLAVEDVGTDIEFAVCAPGRSVDDVAAQTVTIQGLAAQPLTLTDLTLTDVGPGNQLLVEWTYRSLRSCRFRSPGSEPSEGTETVRLQFWNSNIAGITGSPVYEVDVPVAAGAFTLPAPWGASVTGGTSVACRAIVRSSIVGIAAAVTEAEVTATYTAPAGGGVTDHGALTGLGDDDHAQYHNDARGDARYAQRANDLSDLASAATARGNLGLGDSATKNVGTGAGTVAAGDHVHAASAVTFSPVGTIAATDVQSAVAEVATDAAAALSSEASTRSAADTTLQGNIDDEAAARATADGLRQLLSGKDAANGYAGLDANARLPSNKIQVTATDRLIGRDTAAAGPSEEISVGGGLEFTGAGGIQRSALTGDVTASAGSGATTIANNAVATAKIADDAVTYAKMQNVSATDKVLGRKTAGSGDPEEIDCTAQGRALIGKTGIESMRQYLGIYRIWEDFAPIDFSGTWSSTITGTGQAYAQGIGFKSWMSESSTQGVLALSCNTGTVSTDASCVHGNSTWAYLSDGSEFIFRIGHSNSTSALHRFGLRDAAPAAGSTDVTNGVYFEFDSAASANWLGCSAAASTRTKTSTGYAATNTTAAWQWFKIKFNSTAGGVTFSHWSGTAWVDDLTVTTNIPASGSTRSVRPFFQTVYNGATFREFYCDAFGCNPGQVSSAGLPPVF